MSVSSTTILPILVQRFNNLLQKHISPNGAKKVIIAAPSYDAPTFIKGVNYGDYKPTMTMVSSASGMANCAAPLLQVIHNRFGVANCLLMETRPMLTCDPVLNGSNNPVSICDHKRREEGVLHTRRNYIADYYV